MRADSDRLIAGGVGHIFARKPRRPSRKPWSTLPVSEAAGLAAAIRPYLANRPGRQTGIADLRVRVT